MLTAPKVARLHLVDASDAALEVARRNLSEVRNVEFHNASVGALPFADCALDFAYSLGVLHHVPDTAGAIAAVARKLKPGAPFLVFLYYNFENRPQWYRALWRATNYARLAISRMPSGLRYLLSQAIAGGVYWPLARSWKLLDRFGLGAENWPLKYYSSASFYVMRTDALDRFGTRLEKRFTRTEIRLMLQAAGFAEVRFSEAFPYWCAVGIKS
jgi:ubiquinone/menaquinone biosynthesis C-methylase UbiE